MSNDAYTHYVVLNEMILGEACIIEKCLLIMINRYFYAVSQTITE